MKVRSLRFRDDGKNNPGRAVVEFSGEELIALNKMAYHATKELYGKSDALELRKSIYLLNTLVQHGNLDTNDILILDEIDTRLQRLPVLRAGRSDADPNLPAEDRKGPSFLPGGFRAANPVLRCETGATGIFLTFL